MTKEQIPSQVIYAHIAEGVITEEEKEELKKWLEGKTIISPSIPIEIKN